MRILKRITSLLLVMAMLCSVAVFADEAAAVETAETVVVDASYDAAVAKLNALGFWTYGDQNDGEVAVTRGEFAYMAANLVNMADYDGETESMFRDVPTSHPYFQAISFMYDLGVVSGEFGGLYRPDDSITYAEAMKILTFIMGYEGECKDSGGYPAGHLFVANKIGVGVDGVSGNQIVTRKICAAALANAVDVEILAKIIYGAKFIVLTSTYGKTILTEYYDVYKAYGVVNAVGATRATAGTKLNKSVAEIGGVAFEVGTSNVKTYIGYRVNAYYKAAENVNERATILYVEPVNNETIEILGDHIDNYDAKAGKLYYYKNLEKSKRSSIKFDINTDNIIYNNVRSTTVTEAKVESADRIFAIDNDRNGKYDVIFIDYETVVMVKSTDSANFKIYSNYVLYDADGNSMGTALDIEDDGMLKVTNLTDRYGNDIDLSALSFGTILNVLRSDVDATGAVTTTIVVTNQTVTGTVSEIGKDASGYTTLLIDGAPYTFAKNENEIIERPDIALGNKYTFYLDVNNKIAGMGAATTTDVYGFLVKAAYATGMETMPEVKMFTTDGKFVTYKFADNAKINGKSRFASQDDIIREFFNVGSSVKVDLSRSEGIIAKPVTYRLNANGEISRMITAKDNTNITLEQYYDLSTTENKMIKFPLTSNPMYIRNPLIFAGMFKIASSTKVFLVPERTVVETVPSIVPDKYSEDTIDRYNDIKYFKMGNVDSFKSYGGVDRNKAFFYDLNLERVSSMVVYQKPLSDNKLSKSTGITVVKRIDEVLLDNGETGYKLYGMRSGADVEIMISTEELTYSIETINNVPVMSRVFITDEKNEKGEATGKKIKLTQTVEQGDMIRFVTNSAGELYDYEKIFDFSDDDDPGIMTRFGYATAVKSDLSVDADGDYENTNDYENSQMAGMKCMISITDKYLEEGTGKGYYSVWHGSNKHYFYGVGFKFIYTEALDIIGNTLFYRVLASRSGAYGVDTEEIASISGYKVTIIDATEPQMRIYAGTRADIVPRSVYGDDGQGTMMMMYLSDASPKEVFIVKK